MSNIDIFKTECFAIISNKVEEMKKKDMTEQQNKMKSKRSRRR